MCYTTQNIELLLGFCLIQSLYNNYDRRLHVRMAERSKAPDSSVNLSTNSRYVNSGPQLRAWVQIPLLTNNFFFTNRTYLHNFTRNAFSYKIGRNTYFIAEHKLHFL